MYSRSGMSIEYICQVRNTCPTRVPGHVFSVVLVGRCLRYTEAAWHTSLSAIVEGMKLCTFILPERQISATMRCCAASAVVLKKQGENCPFCFYQKRGPGRSGWHLLTKVLSILLVDSTRLLGWVTIERNLRNPICALNYVDCLVVRPGHWRASCGLAFFFSIMFRLGTQFLE